jgi:hypothetical protein
MTPKREAEIRELVTIEGGVAAPPAYTARLRGAGRELLAELDAGREREAKLVAAIADVLEIDWEEDTAEAEWPRWCQRARALLAAVGLSSPPAGEEPEMRGEPR